MLDIQLYEYIVQLFYEQKDIINTYYVNSNLADATPWDWDDWTIKFIMKSLIVFQA